MKARVLVIEDNSVTRRMVRFALERESIEVHEASHGESALALARSSRPHVVLLDLVLPDVSGFDLLVQLRPLLGPHTPILAFTGLLSADDEVRLGASRFDDVIVKPIEPSRLLEVIRAYLPARDIDADHFGTGKRLLLVDDDARQLKLTAFRLGRLGFEVTTAQGGAEALSLVKGLNPHVVVSDVLMPKIDGFALCSQLREEPRYADTVVVLVTNNYVEESDRVLAEHAGADGYVIRSPDLHELRETLRALLQQSARRTHRASMTPPALRAEHSLRAAHQLDRQVSLNAVLAQRSALLSAELTILAELTEAIASHRDVDAALDFALSACFDAGGISWGVLLVKVDEGWSHRCIGIQESALRALAPSTEALMAKLGLTAEARSPFKIDLAETFGTGLVGGHALLTPILHQEERLGALLLGIGDRTDEHLLTFAGVVAGQIALVLTLARTFRALDRASKSERNRARVLESILDAIDDPIVVYDTHSTPSHWNRAAARHVAARQGLPVEAWPARFGYFHPDQSTLFDWRELPSSRALEGESASNVEVFVRDERSSPRWMEVSARPVLEDTGSVQGAVTIFRDVTEARRAQERQLVADRMASIGVLAAGVAHEINNPLTAVIAELELSIEDLHRGACSIESLTAARDAAQRVRTIVQDMKTLSRAETEEVEEVDLTRVLQTAVRLVLPQTRQRAEVQCDFEPVPLVAANEPRLVQVFLNLLVNAAQAIPTRDGRRHSIQVRTRPGREGGALVEVADTGVGMVPEVKARLFTPFFTTKPVGTGTGLGLSISHQIVHQVGGTLDCESTPQVGTIFSVWFPAATGGRKKTPSGANSVPRRLLIIDADPLVRQLVVRAVRGRFEVFTAPNLSAALDLLEQADSYEAVVFDLFSDLDAITTFYATLRARHPRLAEHLLFLVSPSLTPDKLAFLDACDNPRIAKPLDPRTLLDQLLHHLTMLSETAP